MDKYEYKLKLDQMKALAAEGDYATAAEIADSINWRKVRNINLLIKAGDIYAKQKRYEEAKDILLMAYDRSPIGRMIIYRLAEIAIKMKNFEEAEEYYDEFVEIAPHDNLKYVLRYRISKAKGSDIRTQIMILEELKEVEYTEEWAYELAYLYHRAGESEKCIDACDELILWFGDGVYVERALELKMLYQPLTKSQEDKYRTFKQHRDGVKEVYPHEETTVTIPVVTENVEKFNTTNLQEELAKSMQQIMDATEKETVEDTMDNIKKMVEEIPYLQMPYGEVREDIEEYEHVETDEEIDGSLRINFKEMLAEDYDGQFSMLVKGKAKEPQVHGQMSIEDVLSEWERTKRAAQAALKMAEQQKLESAKARALQEAGDIMERLADVIPKLDAGITPAQLLREEYLTEGNISDEERASRFMEGMNNMLQQEIDRLQGEAKEEPAEHELFRKIKQAKPNFDEQIGLRPYIPEQFEKTEADELPEIADPFAEEAEVSQAEDIHEENQVPQPEAGMEMQEQQADYVAGDVQMPEQPADYAAEDVQMQEQPEGYAAGMEMPEQPADYAAEDVQVDAQPEETYMADAQMPEQSEESTEVHPKEPHIQLEFKGYAKDLQPQQDALEYADELMDEALSEEMRLAEAEFFGKTVEEMYQEEAVIPQETTPLPQISLPEDIASTLLKQDTKEIKTKKIAEALDNQMKKIETEGEDIVVGERPAITKLSEQQKEIFSYFVPVDGMERQICQVLTGASARLAGSKTSATGNILIQGGRGCGKTVLATGLIKALQKEVKRPNGKIGKIDAEALNKKDLSELLKKVAGGCLIIEKAGDINRETAVKLSLLLENDTSGLLVIMEDTRVGLNQALGRDEGLAKKFTEKITIPVFTSDELVEFGKAYANDLDYEIDNMGVLALYNRISNIQRLDRATTLTEVKEIVDEAIERAEKKTLKKAISIITSRRYTEDDYVILREKDFEE